MKPLQLHSGRLFPFLSVFFFLVLLSACVKHVAGPKGDKGVSGGSGNARIKANFKSTINSAAWKETVSNSGIWEAKIGVDAIDNTVLDNGAVDVFGQFNGSWAPLPYVVVDVFTQAFLAVGYITIQVKGLHGSVPRPETTDFRVMVYTNTK